MSDLEHTHDHEHEHCGEHTHPHTHDHGDMTPHSDEENLALLGYMIEHNEHHGEDLHELYHSLENAGKHEAATLVGDALHYYEHGNEKLAEAKKLLETK